MSDSPGLVDFAIGIVNPVLSLPEGQVKFFWEIQITATSEIKGIIAELLKAKGGCFNLYDLRMGFLLSHSSKRLFICNSRRIETHQ